MRWLLLAGRLTTSLLLAGRTVNEGGDAISPDQPATSLTVQSASERPGRCFADPGQGDGYCHEIVTLVDNQNNRKDFSTSRFNWDARDADGGVYDTPDVEGPDAIGSEGQGSR